MLSAVSGNLWKTVLDQTSSNASKAFRNQTLLFYG